MAVAVSTGNCPDALANRMAGPIHHARWLTKISRVLRKYVSTEKPSRNLRVLVTFIMKVYVPTYFNIKYHNSCTKGSIHFLNLIKFSRYLEPEHFEIVKKVCKDNGFFAHPENILLAMIYDDEPQIRQLGFQRILTAREEMEETYGKVRSFIPPHINFDAENYYDLFDWNEPYSEPPFTRTIPYEELVRLALYSGIIDDNVRDIECHNQACERNVKAVSEVAMSRATQERREGMILATIASREKRPKFDSKQDFV